MWLQDVHQISCSNPVPNDAHQPMVRVKRHTSVVGKCYMYMWYYSDKHRLTPHFPSCFLFPSLPFPRAFDVELLYIAQQLGMPMKEVAVNWKEIEGCTRAQTLTVFITSRSVESVVCMSIFIL